MEKNIMCYLTPKNQVAYITDNMSIRQGIEKMRAHGFSAIPILGEKDGTYKGVVTEGDFLWAVVDKKIVDLSRLETTKVTKIIRKKRQVAKIDTKYEDLLEMIVDENFIPVVDDRNILMGIITRKSIINSFKV